MTRSQIKTYYDATEQSKVRAELEFAVSISPHRGVAIDSGCGAGSDIAFLLEQGFTVYGFDMEEDAISRCEKRFKGNERLTLSQEGFDTFQYPKASLVVADASLFFCPPDKFEDVWNRIYQCLESDGVFSGSFLGLEDSMAQLGYNKEEIWPDVLALSKEQVRSLFERYDIVRFNEHRSSGTTPAGTEHDWQIFSVVAVKTAK